MNMLNNFIVSLGPLSRIDILDIFNYILYSDGIEQAKTTKRFLEEKIASLRTFPGRGKYSSELAELEIYKYRELSAYPWRIFYEINDNYLDIIAILDGRRDLKEILKERLLN